MTSSHFSGFKESLNGRDAKTIKAYVLALGSFVSWLEQQSGGAPFDATKISTVAIDSYLAQLVENLVQLLFHVHNKLQEQIVLHTRLA